MKRGRPFEPGNKFGRGRRRGSQNKKSSVAQDVLSTHADAILRKAVVLALQGDTPMVRLLVSYVLGRPSDSPIRVGPLPVTTAEELDESSEVILKKASEGKISLTQAQDLAALLEARRRVIDTREHEARLAAIEEHLKTRTD
jgi:hypothetical protein